MVRRKSCNNATALLEKIVKLTRTNCWTYASNLVGDELEFLKFKLTLTVGRGRQSVKTSLLNIHTDPPSFPSGWTRTVIREAKAAGFPVEVDDQRVKPCASDWNADLSFMDGRAEQRQVVEALVKAEQGMLEAPTGMGKTACASGVMKVLPCRWLFLVADKSLLDQSCASFVRFCGETPGKIGDGHWSEGRITVAMVQSLYAQHDGKKWSPKARAFLDSVQGVICDEVHGSGSSQHSLVLRALRNAYYRLGISATTSGRGDRRDAYVIGHFGKVVHQVDEQQMAQEGKIATASIQFIRCDQPGTRKYQAGGYESAIVRSQQRNGMVIGLLRTIELPALIYTIQLDHVRYLGKLCETAGFSHVEITGPTTTKERKARVLRMEERATDVVIATNAARQGLDLIHIRSVILAGGNREEIGTIQRKGRGGRVCMPGQKGLCATCDKYGLKDSMNLYDFYDFDSDHNRRLLAEGEKLTSDNRHWLEEHTLRRIAAFKKRGAEIKVIA